MPINPLPAPTAASANIQVPAGTFGSQYGFLPLAGEGITETLAGYFKGKETEQKTEFQQEQERQKGEREQAAQQSTEQYRAQDISLRQQEAAATADYRKGQQDIERQRETRAQQQAEAGAFREWLDMVLKIDPSYLNTPEGRDYMQKHGGITLPPTSQQPTGFTMGQMFPNYGFPENIANATPAQLKGQGFNVAEAMAAYKPQRLSPQEQAWDDYFNNRPLGARQQTYIQSEMARLTRAGRGPAGPSNSHLWAVQMKFMEAHTKTQALQAALEGYQGQMNQPNLDPKMKAALQQSIAAMQGQLAEARATERAWQSQLDTLTGQKPAPAPARGVTRPGTPGKQITNSQVTSAYQDYLGKNPKKPMTLQEYIKRLRDNGYQILPQ